MHDIWLGVLDALTETLHPAAASRGWVLTGVLLGTVLVATPAWGLVRPLVTVVHELGHAVVGMLCGRRFTGFVVSADMSGHTVTRGCPRGVGIVLTTAAGYPAPALVGALMVWGGSQWSRLVVLVAGVAFLVALVRSRSVLTVVVLTVLTLGAAALWWVDDAGLRPCLVVALGVVLLVGAWRQWLTVVRSADPGQDPAALARLSGIPAPVWNTLFLVVIAASAAWAAAGLWPILVSAVEALRPA